MTPDQDIDHILVTSEALEARVLELAERINRDYEGKSPVVIGVLRGSFIFMADLIRRLKLPCRVDFLGLSSYGNETTSSGAVRITRDVCENIEGRDVLIIEDILDTGTTMAYLVDLLNTRKPASVRICVLLDKPSRRQKPITPDYFGFEIPDAFVVGYGLDYAEFYRNLPYIGVLKPSVYQPGS